MLNAIIDWSLRYRVVVIVAVLLAAAGGVYSLRYLAIDAFPDTTPVQVQINTVAPALAPEQVDAMSGQLATLFAEQRLDQLQRIERSLLRLERQNVQILGWLQKLVHAARATSNERHS